MPPGGFRAPSEIAGRLASHAGSSHVRRAASRARLFNDCSTQTREFGAMSVALEDCMKHFVPHHLWIARMGFCQQDAVGFDPPSGEETPIDYKHVARSNIEFC